MLHQPLRRSETELPVADLIGDRPQVRALLILKDDEVVPRPLLIPHEKILAVGGVDAGPVLLAGLGARDRRMLVTALYAMPSSAASRRSIHCSSRPLPYVISGLGPPSRRSYGRHEHRRAADAAVAQIGQRAIRVGQIVARGVHLDRHAAPRAPESRAHPGASGSRPSGRCAPPRAGDTETTARRSCGCRRRPRRLPGTTCDSASGISRPTGAKMIAASSGSGGGSFDPPAQVTPRSRANACFSSSPGDVNA